MRFLIFWVIASIVLFFITGNLLGSGLLGLLIGMFGEAAYQKEEGTL
jgi:hypothetical protein